MVGIHKHSSLLHDFWRGVAKEGSHAEEGGSWSVYRNTKDWRSHLSAFQLYFPRYWVYSWHTLTVTLVSLCTDWYHADIWDQTHTHTQNSTCLLLLLYPQKLLDAVNYILWVVRWCLCNYPLLYSEIKFEWGLEKFIKRTYLNSRICFQNSGRPSGSAAGWLYGTFFGCVYIVLGNIVYGFLNGGLSCFWKL